MMILCGTDFTAHGTAAATAAAALAERMQAKLVLVHAIDALRLEALFPDALGAEARPPLAEASNSARERLRATRESLARFSVRIETEVLAGIADEMIVAEAAQLGASMIVVGALGRRSSGAWSLGGTADRVAQMAKSAVLVARASEPFERWSADGRPLSVLAAVDASPPSDAAVRWLAGFAAHGPCRIIAAHVYWPPEQRDLRRARGGLPIGKGHADIEQALGSELRARFGPVFGALPFELRLVGGLGRPADHLAQIAAEEHADLVVVGNHQRVGLDRFWHGSVSHGVIDRAEASVMCVPSS